MHRLLRCNINAGVLARGWSGRVTRRCHNSPDRNGAREFRWRHAQEARGGFWGFWKSQLSSASGEDGWLSLAPRYQASGLVAGATRVMGCRWKSQNRKNVYLSPYVEKPFNSKVIKSSVPELRSGKCFSCFEIPMFYVYMLGTFSVRFTQTYLAMVHILFPYNY